MTEQSFLDLCLKQAKIQKYLDSLNSELTIDKKLRTSSYYYNLIKYRFIQKDLIRITNKIQKIMYKNLDLLSKSEFNKLNVCIEEEKKYKGDFEE